MTSCGGGSWPPPTWSIEGVPEGGPRFELGKPAKEVCYAPLNKETHVIEVPEVQPLECQQGGSHHECISKPLRLAGSPAIAAETV